MRLAPALLLVFATWFCACAHAPTVTSSPAVSTAIDAGVPAAAPTPAPSWVWTPPPGPLEQRTRIPPVVSEMMLPNGLRVVVVEHHRRPIVSVRFVIPNGSAFDGDRVLGSSYLALALLGDERELDVEGFEIPNEKPFRQQVIEAGGRFTFGLGEDGANVGIDGFSVDAAKYVELLAGAVREPRAGPAMFKARRNALRDELGQLELNDSAAFGQVVLQAAFGASHPYGRSSIGTQATLKALEVDDVRGRQETMLRPKGATLLIVGSVNRVAMFASARKWFGDWSESEGREVVSIPRPKVTKKNRVALVARRPAFTTGICAARPLTDVAGSDAELDVLAYVLGNIRLNESLREQRGLTYSTSSEILRHRGGRALISCTRVRATDGAEGLKAFVEAVKQLRVDGPSDAEVERAKATLISELQASDDTVASLLERWLKAYELGEAPDVAPKIAALRAVTTERVKAVASKVLAADAQHLVVWGDPNKAKSAIAAAGLGSPSQIGLTAVVGEEDLGEE